MINTTIQDSVPIESETEEMVLAGTEEVKPSEQDEPGISNSGRIDWLEQAYRLLREELLPEALSVSPSHSGFHRPEPASPTTGNPIKIKRADNIMSTLIEFWTLRNLRYYNSSAAFIIYDNAGISFSNKSIEK
jgi:hypothetical protein